MENWNHLSDEEKARLSAKTPIAKDDETAICTEVGWKNWKKFSRDEKKQASRRERETEEAKQARRRR